MFKNYITLIIVLLPLFTIGQDLPLFNQKLTNSFIYNPSVAGNGKGSLTFSNRTFWNGVPGAPKTNLFSGHMPFAQHKMGAGINVVQERIGVSDNLYATGAFAYHLSISDEISLSFGLSTEYTNLRFNSSRFDARDESDVLLIAPESRSSIDFSFGTSLKHPLFEIGFSSNRLATALKIAEFNTQISQFYTAYGLAKLPLTDKHLLEPTFVYRKLSTESSQWEAGLFYSYNEALILGASYRAGGIISPAIGLKLADRILLGYSFEMFGSGIQKEIGGTNEITLRLDFMDNSFYKNNKNGSSVMQQSIAFRRKTLSYNRVKGKPMSASNPKFKKKIKRNYTKSPSYRMNNSKKLRSKKTKPKFNIGKRKPIGASKFKSNKRRKTGYKKSRKRTRSIR